jgi:hypothetical protein
MMTGIAAQLRCLLLQTATAADAGGSLYLSAKTAAARAS